LDVEHRPDTEGRLGSFVRLQALAASPSGFAHFLAALDRRLHVVTPPLEFTENTLCCHLALEVLDGPLDPLLTDGDFEGFALD
jgi:hypothetical protein